jgi:hypothetical protein
MNWFLIMGVVVATLVARETAVWLYVQVKLFTNWIREQAGLKDPGASGAKGSGSKRG